MSLIFLYNRDSISNFSFSIQQNCLINNYFLHICLYLRDFNFILITRVLRIYCTIDDNISKRCKLCASWGWQFSQRMLYICFKTL